MPFGKKSGVKAKPTKKTLGRKSVKAKSKTSATNPQRKMLADHENRITVLEGNQPALGALIEQTRSQVAFLAEEIASLHSAFERRCEQFERTFGERFDLLTQVVRDVADGQAMLAQRQERLEAAFSRRESTALKRGSIASKRSSTASTRESAAVELAIRDSAEQQEARDKRLERIEAKLAQG